MSWAGTPVQLTGAQLDRITAGGASVGGSADAAAFGPLSMVATNTTSLVTTGTSPIPSQPGFAPSGGAVDGTALAVGNDLGTSAPTGTTTSVVTGGTAYGNQVITSTVNQTMHGVGGVTLQVGWTFVYGAWIGL